MPLAQRVRLCLFVAILIAIVATPLVVLGLGPLETASEWAVMAASMGAMIVWTWFGSAWAGGVKPNTLEAQAFRRSLVPARASLFILIGGPIVLGFFRLVFPLSGREFWTSLVLFVLVFVPIIVALNWALVGRLTEQRQQAKSTGQLK